MSTLKKTIIYILIVTLCLITPCHISALSLSQPVNRSAPKSSSNDPISADIESDATYALRHVQSFYWLSAPLTGNTGNNIFQHANWNSSAQTFTFVQTEESDAYIIYAYGANTPDAIALCCDHSSISSQSPSTANVYCAQYDSELSNNFEWIAEKTHDYTYALRLKADPRYVLEIVDTAYGSSTDSGLTSSGNIIVTRTDSPTSPPISSQQWNFYYVIQDGNYYLNNPSTNLCMYTTTAAGSGIYTTTNSESANQLWYIQHCQNGLYHIKMGELFIGLASTSSITQLTLTTNGMTSLSMWKFHRLSNGTVQITCAYTDLWNYEYALSVQYPTFPVINSSYANNPEKSQWVLEPLDAFLLGMISSKSTYNRSESFPYVKSVLESFAYDVNIKETYYMTSDECIDHLMESEVFVYRGHGGLNDETPMETSLTLYDIDGNSSVTPSRLAASNIYDYDNNRRKYNLKGLEVALFIGCNTALTLTNRILPEAAVACGAECAVGFNDYIACTRANEWLSLFFAYYQTEQDVREICYSISSNNAWADNPSYGLGAYRIYTADGVYDQTNP